MKKCKICGNPCKSKYCSKDCYNESQRRRYRNQHPEYENFYVFYDKNDFVKFFGTAEQLIADGLFPNKNALASSVSKMKNGTTKKTSVYVLKCKKE